MVYPSDLEVATDDGTVGVTLQRRVQGCRRHRWTRGTVASSQAHLTPLHPRSGMAAEDTNRCKQQEKQRQQVGDFSSTIHVPPKFLRHWVTDRTTLMVTTFFVVKENM